MATVHKAMPLSGKTSFFMMCNGYGSATVNFKRKGKTLKITGAGGNAGTKNLVLRILGTNADNTNPSHVGDVTTLEEVTITTTMAETEIDICKNATYDRIIIHSVYGSGTVGTGPEAIYIKVEN